MEMELEHQHHDDDDDDDDDDDAEHERHNLLDDDEPTFHTSIGNGNGNSNGNNGGIDRIHVRSEHENDCSSRHLPKSPVGRWVMVISAVCNVVLLLRLRSADVSTTNQSEMPLLSDLNMSKNNNTSSTADCAVALSTFPNSGTSWTQVVFSSATGLASLAIYPEGPLSPFHPTSYLHNQLKPGGDIRLPDPAHGECLFVKTHRRIPYDLLTDHHPRQRYQRAVVLYREPEDNWYANLRYLTKLRNDNKHNLLEVCSYDPHGTPLPQDTNLERDWSTLNGTDYGALRNLHKVAHKRFYCHAERYPAPTMMVTYARLLSNPRTTFRDILTFSGYADADVDRALEEHPPKGSHDDVHGSLDYVPVDLEEEKVEEEEEGDKFDENDPCAGMSRRFQKLWDEASPCAKAAAKMLQFIY